MAVVVTFSVQDDLGSPIEGAMIRLYTEADTFLTEFETGPSGEETYALSGSPDPGTIYIVRVAPPAGYRIPYGPTQTIFVLEPVGPPDTNQFDFIAEKADEPPESTVPNMCRITGGFIDSGRRPLKNLSLIFHPREGYPTAGLNLTPYGGEPSIINGSIVASEFRANTDLQGNVDFELPRGGVFDVFIQGLDAPDVTLLTSIVIPDVSGIGIVDVLYPYVTEVEYSSDTISLAVGETFDLGVTAIGSNLEQIQECASTLLDFTLGDESVAAVNWENDKLVVTALATGSTSLQTTRKPGTFAPRLPTIGELVVSPSIPTITVT